MGWKQCSCAGTRGWMWPTRPREGSAVAPEGRATGWCWCADGRLTPPSPLPSPAPVRLCLRSAPLLRLCPAGAVCARDDAGGAPRGSARTVAVACIIGPSIAREPCADARSSPRALDPLRLDDARDGVPKRWRSASAREAARGGGRSGRGRRASRESVQAREPTAAVSCERAVPLVSRGVSLRNRVTQRLRISAHAPGHVPRAATVDFSGSTTPPNLITPAKRVSGSNRRVPGLKTPWRLQGLGVCTGTQNSDNIRKNLARGHSAQANLLRERLSSLFTHTRL